MLCIGISRSVTPQRRHDSGRAGRNGEAPLVTRFGRCAWDRNLPLRSV